MQKIKVIWCTTKKVCNETQSQFKFFDKKNDCLAKEDNKTYEKVVQPMSIVLAFGTLPFKYMERVSFLQQLRKNFQAESGVVNQLTQL